MKKPTIAIGNDHRGYQLKTAIREMLEHEGYSVNDFGAYSEDSVDYPDFTHPLAESIENGENELGILICGSGNGVNMAANKHKGIRAALCWNEDIGKLARQHNNANVVCLSAMYTDEETAKKIVHEFLNASYEGGRHEARVKKIGISGTFRSSVSNSPAKCCS